MSLNPALLSNISWANSCTLETVFTAAGLTQTKNKLSTPHSELDEDRAEYAPAGAPPTLNGSLKGCQKKKRWQKDIQNLILPKIKQYDLILQTSMIQAKKKGKEMAYF